MFHLLRKLVILLFVGLLAGLAAYAYQKRAVFSPVMDFAEVLLIRKDAAPRPPAALAGQVLKVQTNYVIRLKSDQGLLYHIRLSGLDLPAPEPSTNAVALDLDEAIEKFMSRLVLSNHVQIEATVLSEQRSGLGVAFVGETNVNAAVAEAGLAKVNRGYLKGLTVGQMYALVRAERKARERGLGVWKP